MPLIKVQTSADCSDEAIKQKITKELSKLTADCLGKPEMYVSAMLIDDATITFGGEIVPGAFVEVKSIGGLTSEVNNSLSKSISECITENMEIEAAHIYINFVDVPASDWGWQGSTFG